MKKVVFALVGCGHIASRHIKIIQKSGILQAVVDAHPATAAAWGAQYNCASFTNLPDLFKNTDVPIDVLVICSPNGYHFQHAETGLLNNCNILCEKPLTLRANDAILLQQLAARQQKLLFTVQSMRYNPIIQFLKKALEQQQFGKALGFQLQCIWNRPPAYFQNFWKGTLSLDGGPLFTQFSHYIDVLQWFFGEVVDAQGVRQNLLHKEVIDFEDQGIAQISTTKFLHGGLFWSINAHQKNYEIGLTINLEQLTLKIGGAYMNEIIYCSDHKVLKTLQTEADKIDPSRLSFHQEVYDDFLLALAKPEHFPPYTDDVIKTIRSIETIYQATPLI
jgi:UDP-N-acetyl-2-amino-2-deoxyglucuronate dehydrogenase